MAAKDKAGTLRGVILSGIPFRVAADCNATMPVSEYENSPLASSGSNMLKMVKRPLMIEGIVLLTNSDDLVLLKGIAESLDNTTLALINAAGDTLRGEGTINIENHESEENRTSIQLIPVGSWTTSVN